MLALITLTVAVVLGGLRLSGVPSTASSTASAVTLSDGSILYVQKREVTIAEWTQCHEAGACSLRIKSRKANDTDYPATGLNWFDVKEYVAWANRTRPGRFRLPAAQEWNEIAREVMPEKPDPIFTDPNLRWASSYLTESNTKRALRPSGSFAMTSHGIEDLDGSVWEWTSDCYAGPEKGFDRENCPAFFVAGEHVAAIPVFTRDPARGGCATGSPPPHLGLRLVSDNPL